MRGPVGLALSGGGSRGAFQAGAWEALHDAGVRPDYVAGTSIGAVNGAMIAAGEPVRTLRACWLDNGMHGPRTRKDLWRFGRWRGFMDPRPLRRLLEEHLDLDHLRESPTRFQLTTVDLQEGRTVVWDKEDLGYDHFMASAALPPAFEPVRIAGHDHVDGGVRNNLPLWPAVAARCRTVVALLHDPLASHPAPAPRTVREMVWRVSDINWHTRMEKDLQLLAARAGPAKDLRRGFRFIPIGPDPPLETDMLRFDGAEVERTYDAGHAAAQAALDGL